LLTSSGGERCIAVFCVRNNLGCSHPNQRARKRHSGDTRCGVR
jgi:hypothetical protein